MPAVITLLRDKMVTQALLGALGIVNCARKAMIMS